MASPGISKSNSTTTNRKSAFNSKDFMNWPISNHFSSIFFYFGKSFCKKKRERIGKQRQWENILEPNNYEQQQKVSLIPNWLSPHCFFASRVDNCFSMFSFFAKNFFLLVFLLILFAHHDFMTLNVSWNINEFHANWMNKFSALEFCFLERFKGWKAF